MGQRTLLVVLAVLGTCWPRSVLGDQVCQVDQKSPCRCSTDSFTIDLHSVFPSVENTTNKEDKYLYSPCNPVVLNKSEPAIVWEIKSYKSKTNKLYHAAGRKKNITWIVHSTHPLQFTILYGDGDPYKGDQPRTSMFFYTYGPNMINTTMMFQKKDLPDYQFLVTVRTGEGSSRASSGVAVGVVGLVFMILCLVAMVTYCVVGVVYNYKVKQERGSNLIPNLAFWTTLPFLVKDGCCFTISPCTSKYRSSRYQQL